MRRALLIGNERYSGDEELDCPRNDVLLIESKLKAAGFETTCRFDLKYAEMARIIKTFGKNLSDNDDVFFYFAGHGFHYGDKNYIVPIDGEIQDSWVPFWGKLRIKKMIDMGFVGECFEHNVNGFKILVLDSCRVIIKKFDELSPAIGFYSETKSNLQNCFSVYACSLGKCASEPINGPNSYFASALSAVFLRKNQDIDEMMICANKALNKLNDEQMLCVTKNTKKSYSMIHDNNYGTEMQYYYDVVHLYDDIRDEYEKIVLETSDTGLIKSILYDRTIYKLPYVEKMIREFIGYFLVSIEENIGFIYVLLNNQQITRVDVFENCFSIECEYGGALQFENDKFYKLGNVISFVEKLQLKSGSDRSLRVYAYKDRTVLLMHDDYSGTYSIQIVNTSVHESIERFIDIPIGVMMDGCDCKMLREKISMAIKEKRNIAVVGSPHGKKEEFLSQLTQFFSDTSTVLLIGEDRNIDLLKGQKLFESKSVDEISQMTDSEFDLYYMMLKNKKIDIVVCLFKSYRTDRLRLYKLCEMTNSQIVLLVDRSVSHVKNVDFIDSRQKYVSSSEYIVVMDEVAGIGTVLEALYERQNGAMIETFKLEIDFGMLELYRKGTLGDDPRSSCS